MYVTDGDKTRNAVGRVTGARVQIPPSPFHNCFRANFINFALTTVPFVCIIATETKHRGLVKWYDRGLQNLWWEFDSLIPCS